VQRGGRDLGLARASCRLDEFWQRRTGVPKVAVLARSLRPVHRRLVTTQAVVEHGGGVAGQSRHAALGPRAGVLEAGADERHGVGFDAAPGADEKPGVQQACVARRDRNRVRLVDESLGGHELPGEQMHA
jgi:hypothetical protein